MSRMTEHWGNLIAQFDCLDVAQKETNSQLAQLSRHTSELIGEVSGMRRDVDRLLLRSERSADDHDDGNETPQNS